MKTWKHLLLLCLTLALLAIALPAAASEPLQEGLFYYTVSDGEATIVGEAGYFQNALTIPETIGGYPVTKIGENAFHGGYFLRYVSIPESVTYIEKNAFVDSGFFCYVIHGKQTQCDPAAFPLGATFYSHPEAPLTYPEHAERFNLADYPCNPFLLERVTEGNFTYALYNGEAILLDCEAVGDFVVPNRLGGCPITYIGPDSIRGESFICTLPETVRSIGTDAFDVPNPSPTYLTKLPRELKRLSDNAMIPVQLLDLSMPEGLEEIRSFAFGVLKGDKLVIPGTVREIGEWAFHNSEIRQIVLEEGVERVGINAFSFIAGLESITFPSTITYLDYNLAGCEDAMVYGYTNTPVFEFCTIGSEISFTDLATGEVYPRWYEKEENGMCFKVFPNRALLTKVLVNCPRELVIPETVDGVPVTVISSRAMQDLPITSLYVPDSVRSLDGAAVIDCPELQSVRLSETLDQIGVRCFYNCPKLQSLYVPSSVSSIRGEMSEITFAGWPGSYAHTYAHTYGYPFVALEEGEEYIFENGIYRKDADGAVLLAFIGEAVYDPEGGDITSYYIDRLPDEVDGYPVIGIDANARFEGFYHHRELHLGKYVRYIEAGALTDTYINTLYTTPALAQLPTPLFYDGANETYQIYGAAGSYAEGYAKAHNIPFTPYGGTPFADVAAHKWYYDAVLACYQAGLIKGTSATTFSPEGVASRAMLVTTLWRQQGSPMDDYFPGFFDVGGAAWYHDAVNWAAENGVVYGTSATTFSPDDPVTREQVATILYRLGDLLGEDVSTYSPLTSFNDADKVSDYAKTALMWAVDVGILQGNDKNMLNPKGATTRAEMATILLRYIAWLEA